MASWPAESALTAASCALGAAHESSPSSLILSFFQLAVAALGKMRKLPPLFCAMMARIYPRTSKNTYTSKQLPQKIQDCT